MTKQLTDTTLYFLFNLIYLGHPSRILRKLWIAFDEGEEGYDSWERFSETIKESYRQTAVMAALIASANGALLATSAGDNIASRTLLLSSLTCSIISASSSVSLLSSMMLSNPSTLLKQWTSMGIKFIILLCGPSGWLSNSLLAFEAALLAIAWTGDAVAVKIVITSLIGFAILLAAALPIAMVGVKEEVRYIFGIHESANHRILIPSIEAKRIRGRYKSMERETEETTLQNLNDKSPISAPVNNPSMVIGNVNISDHRPPFRDATIPESNTQTFQIDNPNITDLDSRYIMNASF